MTTPDIERVAVMKNAEAVPALGYDDMPAVRIRFAMNQHGSIIGVAPDTARELAAQLIQAADDADAGKVTLRRVP